MIRISIFGVTGTFEGWIDAQSPVYTVPKTWTWTSSQWWGGEDNGWCWNYSQWGTVNFKWTGWTNITVKCTANELVSGRTSYTLIVRVWFGSNNVAYHSLASDGQVGSWGCIELRRSGAFRQGDTCVVTKTLSSAGLPNPVNAITLVDGGGSSVSLFNKVTVNYWFSL